MSFLLARSQILTVRSRLAVASSLPSLDKLRALIQSLCALISTCGTSGLNGSAFFSSIFFSSFFSSFLSDFFSSFLSDFFSSFLSDFFSSFLSAFFSPFLSVFFSSFLSWPGLLVAGPSSKTTARQPANRASKRGMRVMAGTSWGGREGQGEIVAETGARSRGAARKNQRRDLPIVPTMTAPAVAKQLRSAAALLGASHAP